jgi:hypothetical protein
MNLGRVYLQSERGSLLNSHITDASLWYILLARSQVMVLLPLLPLAHPFIMYHPPSLSLTHTSLGLLERVMQMPTYSHYSMLFKAVKLILKTRRMWMNLMLHPPQPKTLLSHGLPSLKK